MRTRDALSPCDSPGPARAGSRRGALRRRVRDERGVALVIALGVLIVLSITAVAALDYADANLRGAHRSKAGQLAYSLGEAGINEALSVLNNALDPRTGTLLPSTTLTLDGGTATYSGAIDASYVWTITSTGHSLNATGGDVARTLTRTLTVRGISSGATINAWSRFYHDNPAVCLTIDTVTIPAPVSSKGNLCLQNGAKITGSGSPVEVGGNVSMPATTTQSTRPAGAAAGWTSSSNVYASDNNKASYAIGGSAQSANLDVTGFGFSVPSTATVVGIAVRVERRASGTSVDDEDIYLLRAGAAAGTDHASSTDWTTSSSDESRTYGGSSDTWGTTWTPADVNASNFGLRLKADNDSSSSRTAYVDYVAITVYYQAPPSSSIGEPDTPVSAANIAGPCTLGTQPPHAPCSAADQVYASTITTTPENLSKPTIDLAYWWANAKPGPKYPCTTVSGTPPTFDNDAGTTQTWNKSVSGNGEITPENTSYTCQVWENGQLAGELSWDRTTRVLTINGTVFVDGNFRFDDDATVVHYQGRGIIYASGDLEFDERVCAGGSGSSSCWDDMSNWDPTTNMLVLLGGGDLEYDQGATTPTQPGAFQGIVYAVDDCTIHESFRLSGPVVCNEIRLPSSTYGWPTFYTWPPLGSLVDGQVYINTATASNFELELRSQSG